MWLGRLPYVTWSTRSRITDDETCLNCVNHAEIVHLLLVKYPKSSRNTKYQCYCALEVRVNDIFTPTKTLRISLYILAHLMEV